MIITIGPVAFPSAFETAVIGQLAIGIRHARLPVHKAKELALTAKIIHGPEAFALGLVNAVVPVDELDAATQEVVDAIAGGPPVALSLTKRELDNASSSSLAQALEAEATAQSVNVQTDDMREALMAYIERRPPTFTGR